jgi:hypothetical protein
LPETPSSEGASKERGEDVVDGIGGKHDLHCPNAIRLFGALALSRLAMKLQTTSSAALFLSGSAECLTATLSLMIPVNAP